MQLKLRFSKLFENENEIINSQYTALGHFLILGKSLSGQGDFSHLRKCYVQFVALPTGKYA